MSTAPSSTATLSSLPAGSLVHLSGIGGSAMSGLALILRQRGLAVQGTDPNAEAVRGGLSPLGVTVFEDQDGARLSRTVKLVIATAAIPAHHPELLAATALGIPVLWYAQALGELTASRDTLAVAGTHGKTTTASMATWALRQAGRDPGFVIGGTMRGLELGAHLGSDPGFVAEACEYRRSFLQLRPHRAVVTNIEADHLDVYRDLAEIEQAFADFAALLPASGLLLHSADCPQTVKLGHAARCRTESFGLSPDASIRATDLDLVSAHTRFTVHTQGKRLGRFELRQPGRHNVANALAAAAACADMGLELEEALRHLASFPGAHRRFELLGELRGIAVVDDYAHHPTELRALLDSARQRFAGRRLVCVFQPHQSSRTRLLLEDFAQALARADLALIVDIHSVRDSEAEKQAVRAETLRDAIRRAGGKAETVGPLSLAHDRIAPLLEPHDVVLTVGAGPVDSVGHRLLAALG